MWGRYLCTCPTPRCFSSPTEKKIDDEMTSQKDVDDMLTFFKCQPAMLFDSNLAYCDFMAIFGYLIRSGDSDYSEYVYYYMANALTRNQISAFMMDIFIALSKIVKVSANEFPVVVDFDNLKSASDCEFNDQVKKNYFNAKECPIVANSLIQIACRVLRSEQVGFNTAPKYRHTEKMWKDNLLNLSTALLCPKITRKTIEYMIDVFKDGDDDGLTRIVSKLVPEHLKELIDSEIIANTIPLTQLIHNTFNEISGGSVPIALAYQEQAINRLKQMTTEITLSETQPVEYFIGAYPKFLPFYAEATRSVFRSHGTEFFDEVIKTSVRWKCSEDSQNVAISYIDYDPPELTSFQLFFYLNQIKLSLSRMCDGSEHDLLFWCLLSSERPLPMLFSRLQLQSDEHCMIDTAAAVTASFIQRETKLYRNRFHPGLSWEIILEVVSNNPGSQWAIKDTRLFYETLNDTRNGITLLQQLSLLPIIVTQYKPLGAQLLFQLSRILEKIINPFPPYDFNNERIGITLLARRIFQTVSFIEEYWMNQEMSVKDFHGLKIFQESTEFPKFYLPTKGTSNQEFTIERHTPKTKKQSQIPNVNFNEILEDLYNSISSFSSECNEIFNDTNFQRCLTIFREGCKHYAQIDLDISDPLSSNALAKEAIITWLIPRRLGKTNIDAWLDDIEGSMTPRLASYVAKYWPVDILKHSRVFSLLMREAFSTDPVGQYFGYKVLKMMVRRLRLKRYKILRAIPSDLFADAVYATAIQTRLSNANFLLSGAERSKILTQYFLPRILPILLEKVSNESELREMRDYCTSIFDRQVVPAAKDLAPYALASGKISLTSIDNQAQHFMTSSQGFGFQAEIAIPNLPQFLSQMLFCYYEQHLSHFAEQLAVGSAPSHPIEADFPEISEDLASQLQCVTLVWISNGVLTDKMHPENTKPWYVMALMQLREHMDNWTGTLSRLRLHISTFMLSVYVLRRNLDSKYLRELVPNLAINYNFCPSVSIWFIKHILSINSYKLDSSLLEKLFAFVYIHSDIRGADEVARLLIRSYESQLNNVWFAVLNEYPSGFSPLATMVKRKTRAQSSLERAKQGVYRALESDDPWMVKLALRRIQSAGSLLTDPGVYPKFDNALAQAKAKDARFDLVRDIATTIGKFGAIAPSKLIGETCDTEAQDEPLEAKIKKSVQAILANGIYLEQCIYALSCLGDSTYFGDEIDVLSNFWQYNASSFSSKNIQHFTAQLIQRYFPNNERCIPLILKNEHFAISILPWVLMPALEKQIGSGVMNCVNMFLQSSDASVVQAIINVLHVMKYSSGNTSQEVNSQLDFVNTQIDMQHNETDWTTFNALINLQKYPDALQLVENQIRQRFDEIDERVNPEQFTSSETEKLLKAYSLLKEAGKIEEIPGQCGSRLINPQYQDRALATVLEEYAMGNFPNVLLHKDLVFSMETADQHVLSAVFGSMWRLGKTSGDFPPLEGSNFLSDYHINRLLFQYFKGDLQIQQLRNQSLKFLNNGGYDVNYKFALLQHIIENIDLINNEKFDEAIDRSEEVEQKFETLEIIHYINYLCLPASQKHRPIYKLLKLCFDYEKFSYAEQFLMTATLARQDDPNMEYYKFKLSMRNSQYDIVRKLIECDAMIFGWQGLVDKTPRIWKLIEKVRTVQLQLRMTDMKWQDIQQMCIQHPSETIYPLVSKYVEKQYFLRATALERHSKDTSDDFLAKKHDRKEQQALKHKQDHIKSLAFITYLESTKHGHSYAWQSIPRALFLLTRLPEEQVSANSQRLVEWAKSLPIFLWAQVLHQLLALFSHQQEPIRMMLLIIFSRLTAAHPAQLSWFILPFLKSTNPQKSDLATKILERVKKERSDLRYLDKNAEFIQDLIKLASQKIGAGKIGKNTHKIIKATKLCLPTLENFEPLWFDTNVNYYGKELPAFNEEPIMIQSIGDDFRIMQSKDKPKLMTFLDKSKNRYKFLLKQDIQADMNKEVRVLQVFRTVNKILGDDKQLRNIDLQIKIYSIVALNDHTGLVEWLEGTTTIKHVCDMLWRQKNLDFGHRYPEGVINDLRLRGKIRSNHKFPHNDPVVWQEMGRRLRPQLHLAIDTFEKRQNFTRSLAVQSIAGYVIGLGDRHMENILLHENGKLTFIDFECIWGHGETLPVPEYVHFRMTPELQNAMGLYGHQGDFVNIAVSVLRAIKRQSRYFVTQFEIYVHDSLENRINRLTDYTVEDLLSLVDARVNCKESEGEKSAPNVYFQKLLAKSIDSDVLREMWKGWMPWV